MTISPTDVGESVHREVVVQFGFGETNIKIYNWPMLERMSGQ